jgi:hypothetical protein
MEIPACNSECQRARDEANDEESGSFNLHLLGPVFDSRE